MWRIEKEKNETIQKVQIGSVGTGNVGLGNVSLGTTTINSLTTNISTAPSTTTVNIGNTGTSSPSGTVNVGTNSSAINIGSSTTTTIIKSADLTIGTGKNITLAPATNYVTPTALTQLGGLTTGTFTAGNYTSGGTVSSITIDKGVYIICFSVLATYTTVPTSLFFTLNGTIYGSSAVNTENICSSGTKVISPSASTTYNLLVNIIGGVGVGNNLTPATNCYLQAIRIA